MVGGERMSCGAKFAQPMIGVAKCIGSVKRVRDLLEKRAL